jgi:hypothetical protein
VINILVEMAEVWQTLKRESNGGMPDRDVTTIKGVKSLARVHVFKDVPSLSLVIILPQIRKTREKAFQE